MICPVSFVKTIDDSFVNSGFPSEASGMSVNWVNTVVPTVHILHLSPISYIQHKRCRKDQNGVQKQINLHKLVGILQKCIYIFN